jgi:hypothetical protein
MTNPRSSGLSGWQRPPTDQSGNIIPGTRYPAKGSDGETQHVVAKIGRGRLGMERGAHFRRRRGARRAAARWAEQKPVELERYFRISGKTGPQQ